MMIDNKLFWLFLFYPILLIGQNRFFPTLCSGQLQAGPEFGLSNLLGDSRSIKTFAAPGYNFGLHIDKMWNKIGIGLYAGYDKNDLDYPDLFSGGNSGLYISKSKDVPQNNWKQFSIGIGPNYKLDISNNFNIDITSKLGIAKISYQDHGQFYDVDDILNNGNLLYQTKNETIEKKLNLMLFSALRLNYKASKKINLSLSGNYKNVKDVLHSYSYLKGNFNPTMTNEEFLKAIVTASMVTEIRKCNFNSFGVTLGLSYTFGVDKNQTKPTIDTSKIEDQSDSCKNQLIQNGDFHHGNYRASSVSYWTSGYGSPKFLNTPNDGCFDPVEAKGKKVSGDAISQSQVTQKKY